MDEDALELLKAGDIFEVREYRHPNFSHYVSFDDEVAGGYDDAIDRVAGHLAESWLRRHRRS